MTRKRAAVALGTAGLAASVICGAGTAYAWAPGSVTLTATCKDEPGKIVLTVTDKDSHEGSFVIGNDRTSDTVKGTVKGGGTADFTVPYAGAGTTWTVKFDLPGEDVHASVTTVAEPKCAPASPSPSPTPTPTKSVPASPSVTPSSSQSATPTASPSKPAAVVPSSPTASASPKGQQLAFTGAGNVTGIAGGAAALLAAGGAVLFFTRRAARHH